jgi:prefoldin subunit 4
MDHEDQLKLNVFARKTTLLNELKEDLASKKKEIQNFKDAQADLETQCLLEDDDSPIPFRIGESFIYVDGDTAQQMISQQKEAVEKQVQSLEEQVEKIETVLSDLKRQLYAKLGTAINLEADD